MNKKYGEIKEGMKISTDRNIKIDSIKIKFLREIAMKRLEQQYGNELSPINSDLNCFLWDYTAENANGFQWSDVYSGREVTLNKEIIELWKKEFPYMFKEIPVIIDKKENQYIVEFKDKKYKITIKNDI